MAGVGRIKWRSLQAQLVGSGPVRIPAGGTVEVRVKARKRPGLGKIGLELSEAPEGITLQNVRFVPDGLAFQLKAEGEAAAGLADNLIVEAFGQVTVKKQRGDSDEAVEQKQRVSLGPLLAIPFVVVQP